MKLRSILKKAISVFLAIFVLSSATALANYEPLRVQSYSPLSGVEVRLVQSVENGEILNYQVVECDLSNPNLKLDSLYPKEGAGTLKPSREIGADNGAKVVMNADYFNRGNQNGQGSAVGYNAKDGKLISNALEEKVYSFSYQDGGRYSLDIFSNQIKIGFGNRVFEYVKTYNKHSSLEGVGIYDSNFGKESLGSHGTLVELVIENNILTEIRRDMPPVAIPENGFVLAGLSDLTTLFDQVQIGDSVTLEILTTPNLSFVPDFTIGGGSMLVSRGQLVEKMSYPIGATTSFPALGISADGETVWFITVVNQKGITQKKMGELCLREGAYSAINLDGGGSTQCAVIDNTTGKLHYIHELAGNFERPVANAIGVLSTNQNPKPYGIFAEDVTLFSNTPKKFSFSLYDENGNPIPVNVANFSIYSKNNTVTYQNGFLHSTTPGKDVLVIQYDGILKECEITTLAPAVSARNNPDGTYLAMNRDGYALSLTPQEFQNAGGITLSSVATKTDGMAEDKGLPHAISLYGGNNKTGTLFNQLLPKSIVKKLPDGYNPFAGQPLEHPFIELKTIDNSGGKILKADMTEWKKMTTCLQTPKKNILLVMKEPLSFSRVEEEKLFFETLSQAQQNGKNILVIYRGEETKLQKLQDGVRVISLETENSTVNNFLNRNTAYLSIFCNETQLSYKIISENVFSN